MEQQKFLAMYDVRGIQSYIFRTNKVKEIIGASKIVETIIQDALESAVTKLNIKNHAILSWENEEALSILSDEKIQVQVLFIGGGNAYVMYANEEIAKSVCNGFNTFFIQMVIVNKIFIFIFYGNNTIVIVDEGNSIGQNNIHFIVYIIRKCTVTKI